MVNRIHHWLSGKEKYGRHYCLAGTGFAGQPRVLSGSEYKSKTEEERRLRLAWPPEKQLRPGVLGSSWVRLRYCFFVLNISLFFPTPQSLHPHPHFRSKKHNPVIYFIFTSYISLGKEEITTSLLFSFEVTVCHLFRLYNEMYFQCNLYPSALRVHEYVAYHSWRETGTLTDWCGIWCSEWET